MRFFFKFTRTPSKGITYHMDWEKFFEKFAVARMSVGAGGEKPHGKC